jgi:hypothetical protein
MGRSVLGHLHRTDSSGVLVRFCRCPNRKWVAVRPAWQARAEGRRILSTLDFFNCFKFKANENRRELKKTCINLNKIYNEQFLKNPKNYDASSCAAISYSSLSETRSTMTSDWGCGSGLMTTPCGW